MPASVFLDTNILLYFLSKSPAEQKKSHIARNILLRDDCGLSFQVLSECYVNATSKGSFMLPHAQVLAFLDTLDRFPILPSSGEHFRRATELAHHRQLKFWDAAMVASAQMLGCSTLFSEDFQHGQRFGSVRVVNPFL